MIKRIFGTTKELVPIIGQGTWRMPEAGSGIVEAIKSIRIGIESEMFHIDSAEMYGDGHAEELVGAAIQGFPRQLLFLASKVLPENATYKGTIAACERSLKRLGTDYLDCYILHWRGSLPLEETMRALEALVDQGKIRSLGVSNFDVDDLEEAMSYLEKYSIAANQVLYNLYHRGIERRLIPFCRDHSIAVVGYTPFAQKGLPGPGTEQGALLRYLAAKYDSTPRLIILAFLVRESHVFTIPKAARVLHVVENASAGNLILRGEDIQRISDAFPAPQRDEPLAMI